MSDNDVMPKIDQEIVKRETEKEKVANANENEDEIVLEKEVKPRKQKDIFKIWKPVRAFVYLPK